MIEFPHVVDSSLLGAFKSCAQKAYLGSFEHWKPGTESHHLVAGKAYATGLETARLAFYRDEADAEESLAMGLGALWSAYGDYEAPEDSPKSALRLGGALEYYFSQYPLGADGTPPHLFGDKHGIEFSFAEPLNVLHPVTGDPILYAGRLDMACDWAGGELYGFDDKTTSRLGPTWPKQWNHRSQFTGYCWGLGRHGFRPRGLVVRGVSILKDSYGTAQAITYRSDWEIERWLHITERTVQRMIECWRSGEWDHNLDHACAEYGGCSFDTVCKSPEPTRWLPLYFTRRHWDPITRTETALEAV